MTSLVKLIHDDCIKVMKFITDSSIDMIFADPPYFLSHGGISYQSGKVVGVDKGDWDKEKDREKIYDFNLQWIKECKRILRKNGTIWITGTFHNIFDVGHILQRLDFKILNIITWQKTAPPPNVSKRMFTHSAELIIWAKHSPESKHFFNYQSMFELNNFKQMTDVWTIPAVPNNEKKFGKHPTQKPVTLLHYIIQASTRPNEIILDPFCGSGTTGVSAISLNRKFIGIEKEKRYIEIAQKRLQFAMNQNK